MKEKQRTAWKTALQLIQAGLILLWMLLLRDTDSYWSVYVLCAGTALACLWANGRSLEPFPLKEGIYLGCFAAAFAAAVLLANYKLLILLPGIRKLLLAAGLGLGGMAVAWQVLAWSSRKMEQPGVVAESKQPGRFFILCFAVISGVYLVYLFGAAYPGYYTPDSFNSLQQIRSGVYVNNHPYWYTMLIQLLVSLGGCFFDSTNAALAVYSVVQILFLAACMSWSLVTLYQRGCPKWLLAAALAGFACLPYHIAFSVTMWKDIPFSASILLLLTSLYRIMKQVGSKKGNVILYAIGAVGLCLMRTNGLALFFVTTLVMLLVLKKDRKMLLILAVLILVFCWVLTNPVLEALDVGETDFVEILAVPFQQVARVITHGYTLSPEDYEMLNRVFDVELIPQIFMHESVDPIKQTALRQDQRLYLKENLVDYGRLWLRLGVSHPGEYLKAWIELTKGYWNGGYAYEIYSIGGVNADMGITRIQEPNTVMVLFDRYFAWVEGLVPAQPLMSIGLQVWLLFGCLALNARKKREELLLTVPLVVLVLGLWLGTPVFSEFRYAYALFLCMPLLLGVTFFGESLENTQ